MNAIFSGVNVGVGVGVNDGVIDGDGVIVGVGVGVLMSNNPYALDAPPPRIPISGLIFYPNITCAAKTANCAFPVLTIAYEYMSVAVELPPAGAAPPCQRTVTGLPSTVTLVL